MKPPIYPSEPVMDRQNRNVWIWIPFVLFFALSMLLVVTSRYLRQEKPVQDFTQEIQSVKSYVALRRIGAKVKGGLGSEQPVGESKTTEISAALKRVERNPIKTSEAARFSVLLRRELKLPMLPQSVAFLNKSTVSGDHDFFQLASGVVPKPMVLTAHSSDFLERFAVGQVRQIAREEDPYRDVVSDGYISGLGIILIGSLLSLSLGVVIWILYLVSPKTWSILKRRYPIGVITAGDGDRLAGRAVIFMLGFTILPALLTFGLKGLKIPGPIQQCLDSVALVLFLAIVTSMPMFGVKDTWSKIFGEKKPILALVGLGVIAFMAELPILLASASLSALLSRFFPDPSHPIVGELMNATSPLTILILFISAAVFAPIIEETVFRGMCMPAIGSVLKHPWWGIGLSAFLFASLHPQGPAGWPPLFAFGMICGYVAYQTGSLLPGMVLHAVHNFCLLAVSLILTTR